MTRFLLLVPALTFLAVMATVPTAVDAMNKSDILEMCSGPQPDPEKGDGPC